MELRQRNCDLNVIGFRPGDPNRVGRAEDS